VVIQRPAQVRLPVLTRPTGRSVRKIGLLGSHTASLKSCPWTDPSWELWGHGSSRSWYRRELDRYFDLHPRACWVKNGKAQSKYTQWLGTNTVPIYMQERHNDVPASVEYPKGRILLEYGGVRRYFKNQTAWMIALAFAEGVTHLGLWGINYGHDTEYEIQRGSAEYWLGRAEERGVQVFLPDECTLLAEPAGLYGYESHDENGHRLSRWAERPRKASQTIRPIKPGEKVAIAEPPQWLKSEIAEEESRRPDWAKWEPVGKTNGRLEAPENVG
jgi:hypothetical protein